ncbi:MAG TPA: MFS transporter [Bryobacteraceae bacterium]|jgi:MFS family permease|nr:MFS transporter [Bryobacteraceae bacterium]
MTSPRAIVKPTSLHWIALGLLVVSVAINYADRGNLGVAATQIEKDLRLDPARVGILFTGFFWSYALFQIVAATLVDRWNVNWTYAAGFLLWSAATGVTGLVSSFGVLFLLRLLLGMGESIAYPAYSKMIAVSFPEGLRGTANGLIDVGSKLGPALGVLVGVAMVHRLTWRGMFIAMGVVSLIWLGPWCFVASRLPSKALNRTSDRPPGFLELVSKRAFWGTVLGLFGGNYVWYFFLSWFPYYFERERHYQKDELALMASLPFFAVALSALISGILADALIRNGRDAGRVRQSFLCIGLLGCGGFMLGAVLVPGAILAYTLIMIASLSLGIWSSNHWALTQRLSGAAAAGRWTGYQNCIGNFAGVAGGWITGEVLAATHSFFLAFAIAVTVLVLGVFGYWFIVGRPNEIRWSTNAVHKDAISTYSGEASS